MRKNRNKKVRVVRSIGIIAVVVSVGAAFLMTTSTAVTPTITQGSESSYGVLAGTTITSATASAVSGTAGSNLGVSTGTAVTGTISIGTGSVHSNDAAAIAAKASMTATYNVLAGATGASVANELGNLTLTAGVHTSAAALGLTGTLTLNAENNANAVFIIKSPSTLTTASSSLVALSNGAQACNVYWLVPTSATLGTNSTFVGHLYASTAIAATTGAVIRGQLLVDTAAVTLDGNTIINDNCAGVSTPAPYTGGSSSTPVISQSSVINSVSSAVCSATTGYIVNLGGTFPTPLTNVSVNGNNLDVASWTQSANLIAIRIPATETKTFTIDVYNGLTPLLLSQTFQCTEAVIAPVVVPTETIPVEVPTETGGELPDTSSNNYNYLLAGVVLSLLGGRGVLLRKQTQPQL